MSKFRKLVEDVINANLNTFWNDQEERDIEYITTAMYSDDNKKKDEALLLAIRKNYNELAEELIHHGANVNYDDNTGDEITTPLEYALRYHNDYMVRFLLKNGAEINQKDSILMWALDDYNVLKELIERGADVNSIQRTGSETYSTPIILAIENNAPKAVIELLTLSGADVNQKNSDGYTAIDVAKKYNPEILRLIK